MVGRSSVSAHADVPVAGSGALAGCRLARRFRRGGRVIQGNHVLLVRGCRTQAARADGEGTVLPEDVVIQLWIRGLPAGPVSSGSTRRKMACRAGNGRGEISGAER